MTLEDSFQSLTNTIQQELATLAHRKRQRQKISPPTSSSLLEEMRNDDDSSTTSALSDSDKPFIDEDDYHYDDPSANVTVTTQNRRNIQVQNSERLYQLLLQSRVVFHRMYCVAKQDLELQERIPLYRIQLQTLACHLENTIPPPSSETTARRTTSTTSSTEEYVPTTVDQKSLDVPQEQTLTFYFEADDQCIGRPENEPEHSTSTTTTLQEFSVAGSSFDTVELQFTIE